MVVQDLVGRDVPPSEPEPEELVVLCAPDGTAVGTAPKAGVHHAQTPLHLAFSCYVVNPDGAVLVTRRALTKVTFPGVRTNSCCGHPGPGEGMVEAVHRRLRYELGVHATSVTLILPDFAYRAIAADGTLENELCPVYRAAVDTVHVAPNPQEVAAAWWQEWPAFIAPNLTDPLSHWASEQLRRLAPLGADPREWVPGPANLLPSAARP